MAKGTAEIVLPRHIGFIMDGNGRWAAKRGLPRSLGHKAGAEALRKVVDACRRRGISYVTLYAFSTENWKRPDDEIQALMKLFKEYLDEARGFMGKNTRIIFLGDKSPFPEELRRKMISLEKDSAHHTAMTVMLAMNYGGRDDIVYAAKRLAQLYADKDITAEDINEKTLGGLLYTGSAPDADLIVRSSGEQRLSNFLLWQSAYAEFYFTDTLWPDFDEKELEKALTVYSGRSRRYGGV